MSRAGTLQTAALIDGLFRGGVRDVVLCPGSRSTTLAVLLYRHPRIRTLMHYDERGAAYVALGLARAVGRPVGVVVTSGTAAANLLPAAVEAGLSGVPLILMTADRPSEMHDVGSAQTIDQRALYGSHAKWWHELAAADETNAWTAQARAAGERAARIAMETPRGVVHLNVPYREPLLPEGDVLWDLSVPSSGPTETGGRLSLDPLIDQLAGQRGVIMAGAQDLRAAGDVLARMAARLGWPLFADPLSNLRGRVGGLVTTYDAWLREGAVEAPSWVVQVGPPPVSRAFQDWTAASRRWLLEERGRWRTGGRPADTVWWVEDWSQLSIGEGNSEADRPPEWDRREAMARRFLERFVTGAPETFEGRAFQAFHDVWTGYGAVLVGNSMPVRDLDVFWRGEPDEPPVYGNRGANGIDGVLSTGIGLALGIGGPVGMVLGDLSFWHDVNALLAAQRFGVRGAVLVINNDGGGIFSTLSQAGLSPDEFEAVFGTPHGLNLSAVAAAVGLPAVSVTEWSDAREAIRAARDGDALTVVEWRTDAREDNARRHKALWEKLAVMSS